MKESVSKWTNKRRKQCIDAANAQGRGSPIQGTVVGWWEEVEEEEETRIWREAGNLAPKRRSRPAQKGPNWS